VITLDSTTRTEYLAETTLADRAQAVLDALTDPVTITVYDGATEKGTGTMATPWATRNAGVLTTGEVTSFAVTSSGTPGDGWTLRFESGSRWIRGTFGLTGSGSDFEWSLPTWSAGQSGRISTIVINATNEGLVAGSGAITLGEVTVAGTVTVDDGAEPHISAVALPTSEVDVTYSLPTGTTYYVSSTGYRNNGSTAADYTSLTSAITAVPRGSVIRIKNGDVQTISQDQGWPLPVKSGTGWIYILPEDDSLIPAAGTRIVSGAYSDTANVDMADLPVIAFASVGGSLSALTCGSGDLNYRFVGIHFRRATGATDPNYGFIRGTGDSSYLVVDRCVVGDTTALSANRGIVPPNHSAVIDCEIDIRSSGSDAQCIWSGYLAGPVLIQNNTLRNASEIVMTGGSGHPTGGDWTPHDWTFRGNWFQWTDDLYTGRAGLNCKNLVEIKDGTRFLFENNVFEGQFDDDQNNCIVLKPTNSLSSPDVPNCSDMTIRWNVFNNCQSNIYYVAGENYGTSGTPEPGTSFESLRRIAVYQNAFLNMGGNSDFGPGRGVTLSTVDDDEWRIIDAYFVHNTVIASGNSHGFMIASHDPNMDFIALNNAFSAVTYPVIALDGSSVATAFSSATCRQNAMVGLGSTAVFAAGNTFSSPTTNTQVFADYANGDYSVTAAYQGIADTEFVDLGFADLGCDLSTLATRTAGVRLDGDVL
jgi:hypothetical protein